jgi:hypothetical protein
MDSLNRFSAGGAAMLRTAGCVPHAVAHAATRNMTDKESSPRRRAMRRSRRMQRQRLSWGASAFRTKFNRTASLPFGFPGGLAG